MNKLNEQELEMISGGKSLNQVLDDIAATPLELSKTLERLDTSMNEEKKLQKIDVPKGLDPKLAVKSTSPQNRSAKDLKAVIG